MISFLVAVLLVVPVHSGSSSAWWDGWQGRVDTNHGLSIDLLAEARRHIPAVESPHIVLPPRSRTTRGVEQWRSTVEAWWPPEQVDNALRVMQCESGGNPLAKNRHSTAAGLMQFLRGTWDWVAPKLGLPSYAEGGPYDGPDNIRAAAWLWAHGGWGQWECKP